MSDFEDELQRLQEERAERQAKLDAQKEAFHERERSEMPQQEKAQQAWDKLKSETELTPDQQKASPEQQEIWRRQENDPRQGHGNAYTAQAKSDQYDRDTDLTQHSMPEMTAQQKSDVMQDIARSMDTLSQELEQRQTQRQEIKQQQ